MAPSGEAVRLLRAAARLLLLAALSAALYAVLVVGLGLLAAFPAARSRWQGRMFSLWARGFARLVAMRVHWQGPVPEPPCLVVANHLSYLDVIVLGTRLPCLFVANSEVARWPVVGHLCRAVGTVFVDRSRKADLPRVLRQVEARLARGRAVAFFPEGTTSAGVQVMPFRPALLELPAALGLPVQAAALSYKAEGGPAHLAVCWWGGVTFFPHFWGLLGLRRIQAIVRMSAQPVASAERKQLATRLEKEVAALFEPMITPEAAGGAG